MAQNKNKFTVEEIAKILRDEANNETIEGQLLKPKLIRELYKQLGEPKEEDFPNEYKVAGRYWKKREGYTTYFEVMHNYTMKSKNRSATEWNIARPSRTKMEIVEEYTRAGWHCRVQAYNVMCYKYVPHPKYKNIWVCFYSSRDCNKYEYIIEKE